MSGTFRNFCHCNEVVFLTEKGFSVRNRTVSVRKNCLSVQLQVCFYSSNCLGY